jgi:hypothetical protein
VTGFEMAKGNLSPVTALMGAKPQNPIIKVLLDDYKDRTFVQLDGSLDLTTNTVRISQLLKSKFGIPERLLRQDQQLLIDEESVIYPSWYFCTPKPGKPNFSVHHFSGSWVDKIRRKRILSLWGLSIYALKYEAFRAGDHKLPVSPGEGLKFCAIALGYGIMAVTAKGST